MEDADSFFQPLFTAGGLLHFVCVDSLLGERVFGGGGWGLRFLPGPLLVPS